MDFILFYSKYSGHCGTLLQEIPLLNEKAVCVDSASCRNLLSQLPYHVKRVPTLFVVDGIDKILKVIEGINDIKNWFILTTYSLSSPADIAPIELEQMEEIIEPGGGIHDDLLPPMQNMAVSSIEDIGPPPDDSDYVLKTSKTVGVKNLAEELQRQRDSYLESTEPPKSQFGARK